jgi:hypothetical protein
MAMLRRLNDEQKRSVRHWAMEFVVVVIGVLIALWLQQTVEHRRALADMRTAEQAIHREVRDALILMIGRDAIDRCLAERAQLIRKGMAQSGPQWPALTEHAIATGGGAPGVITGVYNTLGGMFSTAVWDSALSRGSLAPMDLERFGKLVALYDQIKLMREASVHEEDAIRVLSSLANPMQLTPEIRNQMLQAVWRVERSRWTYTNYVGSSPFAEAMRDLGWDDRADVDRFIKEFEAQPPRGPNNEIVQPRSCVRPLRNPFTEQLTR